MIGIYDSGIGGLGIFKTVRSVLPDESIWYYGDTRYMPFGDRPADEVRTITLHGLQRLASQCAIIVIACNTASMNDLEYLRSMIAVPIIGVVPVIKTATQISQNGQIALLATVATCQSPATDHLIQQLAHDKQVIKIACSGLASAIEHATLTKNQLGGFLQGINGADVVVLGCTHYTLIKGLIQNLVGPDVRVIDSNEAVARQVLRVMRRDQLEQPSTHPAYQFDCSGNKAMFDQQIKKYLA
ncbi:MAG: glutamate racemase [Candidatus Kerfeldbacteria bacterium]|nr:glutamate racemase [Candidatus Kerfeldbacteria bacterium]